MRVGKLNEGWMEKVRDRFDGQSSSRFVVCCGWWRLVS